MSAESCKATEPASRIRILGIDPGSLLTGYGCIEVQGRSLQHIRSGVIRLKDEQFAGRLHQLYLQLQRIIEELNPHHVVVERVFFSKNAMSALKLGQARGVVLLAAALQQKEIHEYSVTQAKQALTGHGRAEKIQVARLVELILGKQDFETHDVSDALALALCHAQHRALSKNQVSGSESSEIFPSTARRSTSLAKALGLEKARPKKSL